MNNIHKFPKKKISDLYFLIPFHKLPKVYEPKIIDHRAEEINEYHVGLWHRFFVKHYGQPNEIDSFLCKAKDNTPISENGQFQTVGEATFRNTEKSKIEFLNVNSENLKKYVDGLLTISPNLIDWRYFFELPSKNIIIIGSKDSHTKLYISLVNPDSSNQKITIKETQKFISILLEEMKKQHSNLFNPKKKFSKKNVFSYCLWNVYLSNYLSAKHFIKTADREEDKLTKDLYKFPDKSILLEDDAGAHTESVLLVCGAYYSSAISFLFMALEGFINIIFHRFVKRDINDLDMERGLNVEQKIRLMPYLCEGFNNDFNEVASETYKDFIKLKNYRNKIFHSKVEDSLFSLMDYYRGFFYTYQMDEYKNQFLPSYKIKLTKKDVLQVKELVDKMVDSIINAMDKTAKKYTEKYILNSSKIPFMESSGSDPLL